MRSAHRFGLPPAWVAMASFLGVVGVGALTLLDHDASVGEVSTQAPQSGWTAWTAIRADMHAPQAQATAPDAATRMAMLSPEMIRLIKHVLGEAEGDNRSSRLSHARQALLQRLPKAAHPLAMNLFDRYVAYQEALLAGPVPREGDLDAWRRHLSLRDQLRRTHFSVEEIAAFWAEDSRAEAHLLRRMAIFATPGMSDAEREAALRQAESQSFTPDEVAARREGVRPLEAFKQTADFQSRQLSEAERLAQRTQTLGADAAQRLAEVDRQEADWQSRLDRYAAAPPAERAALAESLFSESERRRLDGAMGLRGHP